MKKLAEKVVIVTGGAKGIGALAVTHCLDHGARVLIWDRDEVAGMELQKQCRARDQHAQFVCVDVTSEESVQKAVEFSLKTFGHLDGLVNNAGITSDATLLKLSEKDFDRVISVNLKGPFLTTKAVVPHMIERNSGGSIVNTSSVVAHYGNFGQTNYVASKAGLIGMSKVWAKELGKYQIRVNAVAPGFIETEMIHTVPEKVITQLKEKTPLRRLGTPMDIAEIYVHLLSNESQFTTGSVFNIDGGLTL